MADERRDYGRYLMVAFIVIIFVVLAYYLLQEIPHSLRPTMVPTSNASTP